MNEGQRAFKGVWIPKAIWEALDLSWLDKCMLAEIDSLDPGEGCWATNEQLANRFGVSLQRLKMKLVELRAKGYIKTLKTDGRRRWLRVLPSSDGVSENATSEVSDSDTSLYKERDTNRGTNNVSKETLVNPDEKEPKVDRRNPEVTELVEYFGTVMNLEMPRSAYQRRAAKTLISRHGLPVALRACDAVAAARDYQFAPKILSLEDLRDKWNDLAEFYRKRNRPQEGGKGATRI